MNLLLFFCGYRRVRCDAVHRTALVDLCFRLGIGYTDFSVHDDGGVSFCLSAPAARRLARYCRAYGIGLSERQRGGLWQLLRRYRRRAGVFLGSALALFLLVLSTRFVWAIEVKGNESMTRDEVIGELNACGFGVGAYIPRLQTERLEGEVLIASDRIAWIAIRMDGTHATVQVIERDEAEPREEGLSPANLVAACDGQIEQLLLYRGNCLVSVGQAVRRGELLVSGLYDSSVYPYRYTRASGEVLARTQHELEVKIPFTYTQKVYEKPKPESATLKILGFSLKIFKNSRNEGGSCDIIKEERSLSLPNRLELPILWETAFRHPYVECDATRTRDEALTLAYEALGRELATLSEEAELLEKQIKTEWQDDGVVLRCTVTCIENIAVQSEFEIIEQP